MTTENKRINCIHCQYYYVTWDQRYPKGCKAFGFKTASMPSLTVFQSSGSPCMNFKDKRKNG